MKKLSQSSKPRCNRSLKEQLVVLSTLLLTPFVFPTWYSRMLCTVWVLAIIAIIQGNTLDKELAGERFFLFFFFSFPAMVILRGLSRLDMSAIAELQVSSASGPDSGLLWAVKQCAKLKKVLWWLSRKLHQFGSLSNGGDSRASGWVLSPLPGSLAQVFRPLSPVSRPYKGSPALVPAQPPPPKPPAPHSGTLLLCAHRSRAPSWVAQNAGLTCGSFYLAAGVAEVRDVDSGS